MILVAENCGLLAKVVLSARNRTIYGLSPPTRWYCPAAASAPDRPRALAQGVFLVAVLSSWQGTIRIIELTELRKSMHATLPWL